MKNFTMVPNELFEPSQLSIQARYLHALLLKHCGQKDSCFPSQAFLGSVMSISSRQVRTILKELIKAGLIKSTRKGFNRSNTYEVAKRFVIDGKYTSPHLGNMFPFHTGSNAPTKNTYVNKKAKRSIKGMKHIADTLKEKGLLRADY